MIWIWRSKQNKKEDKPCFRISPIVLISLSFYFYSFSSFLGKCIDTGTCLLLKPVPNLHCRQSAPLGQRFTWWEHLDLKVKQCFLYQSDGGVQIKLTVGGWQDPSRPVHIPWIQDSGNQHFWQHMWCRWMRVGWKLPVWLPWLDPSLLQICAWKWLELCLRN